MFTTASEPGLSEQATPKQVEEYLPSYLEAAGVLNEWLVYYLLGEGKNPTQGPVTPTELFGFGNPGFLGGGGCFRAVPLTARRATKSSHRPTWRSAGVARVSP